jgi:O-antigen ligase
MSEQLIEALGNTTRHRTDSSAGSSATPLPIIRYGFYLFIFTIPIETVDIGIEQGLFSLSHIMGYLFLGTALLQPEICFRKLAPALWCFVAYLFVVACFAIVDHSDFNTSISIRRLATYCQMLVLYWVAFNLFQDQRLIKGALLTLGISCVLLSIIQISGGAANAIGQGRLTALSQDANTLGSVLSLGFLALLGLSYGRNLGDGGIGLLAWIAFGSIAAGIILTGSRGALLSLIAGILVLMTRRGQSSGRIKAGFVAVFAIACLAWASYESGAVRDRWERALTKGNLAGREKILPEAWKMFTEKPLMGWGPVSNLVELGRRFDGELLDTHNSYLWVLTEAGLLGGAPFFVGLWFCWRAAWRARHGAEGSLPLVLVTCVFMVNMSITWLNRKQFWLVLAYAVASEQALERHRHLAVSNQQAKFPDSSDRGICIQEWENVYDAEPCVSTRGPLVPFKVKLRNRQNYREL